MCYFAKQLINLNMQRKEQYQKITFFFLISQQYQKITFLLKIVSSHIVCSGEYLSKKLSGEQEDIFSHFHDYLPSNSLFSNKAPIIFLVFSCLVKNHKLFTLQPTLWYYIKEWISFSWQSSCWSGYFMLFFCGLINDVGNFFSLLATYNFFFSPCFWYFYLLVVDYIIVFYASRKQFWLWILLF